MAVRSDNGREFFGGAFGELCRKRCIKQEFTPADSPKYNGVAERALGLINDAAAAARIQATELYPGAPDYPSLWAEAASWACHALNCTATTANPGDKSPYEMWYGSPPPRGAVWPFLKPAVCRVKRNNKSLPKALDCYYVGPGIDHPRDCIRVLTANRSILTTRNVTWRHVPLSRPAPPQQLPPIAEEGGSTAGEGASGERAPSQGGGGVEEVLDNMPTSSLILSWISETLDSKASSLGEALCSLISKPETPYRRIAVILECTVVSHAKKSTLRLGTG